MPNFLRFPPLIDIHVHLRDPGQTHKEDFFTGTSSALAGGITSVFDMPNNLKPIFTLEALEEKMEVAKKKAVCDYGFYFGTDGENIEEFAKVKELVIGLKVYLTLTTGKYLLKNSEKLEKVFMLWPKEKPIVVHAQKDKIDLALNLANKYGNKLHITHISTKSDLEKILQDKTKNPHITCDVTPHHLFLSNEQISDKVTPGVAGIQGFPRGGMVGKGFYEVKPPLATTKDQDFLWKNINSIDCIATDHAPHTIEEKKSSTPPSGLPGVETMLPLLLNAYHKSKLSLDDITRLLHTGPIQMLGLKENLRHPGGGWHTKTPPGWRNEGNDTYTEVDLDEEWTIKSSNLHSKCGWTPFEGWKIKGRVHKVVIRGKKVFEDGKIWSKPGFGRNICISN